MDVPRTPDKVWRTWSTGAEPVEHFSISIAKVFELISLVFEYLKDVIGRSTGSKAFGKGVIF